jgi:hypothetical protein
VVLSGIGEKSKPLREAGVLHVKVGNGKVKKILCHRYDERVGMKHSYANIDILHHMDQSLDGISSPLLFLI